MKKYLVFDSYQEAVERSEKGATDEGLSTPMVWSVYAEEGGANRGIIKVSSRYHLLTTEEEGSLVDEIPADWVYSPLETLLNGLQ
tara:strand:+ start:9684 stop:9938 length:255 start_codon:yes stop_codon:yes gene_type:complete